MGGSGSIVDYSKFNELTLSGDNDNPYHKWCKLQTVSNGTLHFIKLCTNHQDDSQCLHFQWNQSTPMVQVILNACYIKPSLSKQAKVHEQILSVVYTLCTNCAFKLLFNTNLLERIYELFDIEIFNRFESFKEHKLSNYRDPVYIDVQLYYCYMLFNIILNPVVFNYFRSKYKLFSYLFQRLVGINEWFSAMVEGNRDWRIRNELYYNIAFTSVNCLKLKHVKQLFLEHKKRIRNSFLDMLFYTDNLSVACAYIEKFESRLKEISLENWQNEMIQDIIDFFDEHSDFWRMNYVQIAPSIVHSLVLLYKYYDKKTHSRQRFMQKHLSSKQYNVLKIAFGRLSSFHIQMDKVFSMSKCIWKYQLLTHQSYKTTKCNNIICNKQYLKYNNNYLEALVHSQGTATVKWKDYYNGSKWYKCSSCRLVYYCSKKCQKIDWNRNNHRKLCRKICPVQQQQ
eukprot:303636_1